jgi:hypothetical protein
MGAALRFVSRKLDLDADWLTYAGTLLTRNLTVRYVTFSRNLVTKACLNS